MENYLLRRRQLVGAYSSNNNVKHGFKASPVTLNMTDLDSDEYDWRRRHRGGGSGDYSATSPRQLDRQKDELFHFADKLDRIGKIHRAVDLVASVYGRDRVDGARILMSIDYSYQLIKLGRILDI